MTDAAPRGVLHDRVRRLLGAGVGPRDLARARATMGAEAPPGDIVEALERTTPLLRDGPAPSTGGLIVIGDPSFPHLLAEAWSAGGPLWLRHRGPPAALQQQTVAVVGSRRATLDGIEIASRVAAGLGRVGVTIVSGMARGIDQAAHRGCLAGGGATVAVLGTGAGVDYPAGSGPLRQQILQTGAILSEHADDAGIAHPSQFLARNRIIAGLAQVLVVIDAGRRSGALNSAAWAADMGRTVAAVPASPSTTAAAGSLALLRDGAVLVRDATDVLELLPDRRPTPAADAVHAPPPPPDPLHRRLLGLLGARPTTISALTAHLSCDGATTLAAVAELQDRGFVQMVRDGVVATPR